MSIILYFKGKQLFLLQNQRFSTRLLFLSVFFIFFSIFVDMYNVEAC